MIRWVLHLTLMAAVLASPLVCCCSQVQAATETSAPSCCCRDEQPARAPAKPHKSDCPCQQKQPRTAMSGNFVGQCSKELAPGFNPLCLAADDAEFDESFSCLYTSGQVAGLDVHWFATSGDILRALQTLRL